MRRAGGVSSLPCSLSECTPTTTQPVFAASGESAVMLNSIGKVSHDLSTRAASGIRQPRRRGVHDAVRDRADPAAGAPARPRRGRAGSLRRGDCVPRLLRARRAADPAVAHHVLSLIHISEPTRLLSISYAVFCLKKKKKKL